MSLDSNNLSISDSLDEAEWTWSPLSCLGSLNYAETGANKEFAAQGLGARVGALTPRHQQFSSSAIQQFSNSAIQQFSNSARSQTFAIIRKPSITSCRRLATAFKRFIENCSKSRWVRPTGCAWSLTPRRYGCRLCRISFSIARMRTLDEPMMPVGRVTAYSIGSARHRHPTEKKCVPLSKQVVAMPYAVQRACPREQWMQQKYPLNKCCILTSKADTSLPLGSESI
ncbi:hypothetical protein BJX99DRAFT_1739 [Aspergillus californicus]